MPTTISREQTKQAVLDKGVKPMEVLSESAYDEYHLPHAHSVPMGDDFEEQIQKIVPDKQEHVIVYCKDTDCPASADAAEKMEALGYENVYDYEAGKEDWKQAGLPIEA